MSYAIGPGCNGCGMCIRACPRGAIQTVDGRVEITSLDCNDCGMCAIVCPERVALPDPAWPRCWGRGCPLSSRRFEQWVCSEGRRRCTSCNNAMWREPGSDAWICIRCDLAAKVLCPKVRKASAAAAAERTEPEPVQPQPAQPQPVQPQPVRPQPVRHNGTRPDPVRANGNRPDPAGQHSDGGLVGTAGPRDELAEK